MRWLVLLLGVVLGAAITWFLTVKRATRTIDAGSAASGVRGGSAASAGGPAAPARGAYVSHDDAPDGGGLGVAEATDTRSATSGTSAVDADTDRQAEADLDAGADLDGDSDTDATGFGGPATTATSSAAGWDRGAADEDAIDHTGTGAAGDTGTDGGDGAAAASPVAAASPNGDLAGVAAEPASSDDWSAPVPEEPATGSGEDWSASDQPAAASTADWSEQAGSRSPTISTEDEPAAAPEEPASRARGFADPTGAGATTSDVTTAGAQAAPEPTGEAGVPVAGGADDTLFGHDSGRDAVADESDVEAPEPVDAGATLDTVGLGDSASGAPGTDDDEPVAQEPVAQEPVAQEPVAQEPVAQERVAQEPVAQEPVAQERVAQEPVAQEPAAQEPAAREPAARGAGEAGGGGDDASAAASGPGAAAAGAAAGTAGGATGEPGDREGTGIKGNRDSMKYHTPESPYYARTAAEDWFDTEDDARSAGFRRWDEKDAPAAPAFVEASYGSGSAVPGDDGSGPDGWTVKGNEDSMLYHSQESPYYARTRAEVWFKDEQTAEAAGFTRWDRRG